MKLGPYAAGMLVLSTLTAVVYFSAVHDFHWNPSTALLVLGSLMTIGALALWLGVRDPKVEPWASLIGLFGFSLLVAGPLSGSAVPILRALLSLSLLLVLSGNVGRRMSIAAKKASKLGRVGAIIFSALLLIGSWIIVLTALLWSGPGMESGRLFGILGSFLFLLATAIAVAASSWKLKSEPPPRTVIHDKHTNDRPRTIAVSVGKETIKGKAPSR